MQIVNINQLTHQSIPSTVDILAIENTKGEYVMYSPNDLKYRQNWRRINNIPCQLEVVQEQGLRTQYINCERRY